ncbi:MAG: HAMP domain-containing histidine kinase [Lachnospiraceae bacterium]|nr:HAMP domain-containing histidine kinase [Lachnospiraceae bacterium]
MISKKIFQKGGGLSKYTLFFSFLSFIALLVTNVLAFIILFFLIEHGVLRPSPPDDASPFPHTENIMFLIQNFFISLILGLCSSGFLIVFTAKPIKSLITAINKMADGDFSVRISNTHDKIFGAVNESFNKMADELSSVEMLRNDFINDFSHEFKTPIVSIRGFSKLLQSEDLTEEERNEYLSIIISECDRLSSLSTNVLSLSKLENQKIVSNMETFYLSEQIRQCILLLESKWHEKNISFDLDLENFIYLGNKEMLQEVWMNLIDNAVKFSPKNGAIEIVLRQDTEKRQVYFRIRDYGCGISEQSRKRIFQKFYQEDASHTTHGNGLGLSIAARVIELHNGSLTLGEPQEVGAAFEIRLPILQLYRTLPDGSSLVSFPQNRP